MATGKLLFISDVGHTKSETNEDFAGADYG